MATERNLAFNTNLGITLTSLIMQPASTRRQESLGREKVPPTTIRHESGKAGHGTVQGRVTWLAEVEEEYSCHPNHPHHLSKLPLWQVSGWWF